MKSQKYKKLIVVFWGVALYGFSLSSLASAFLREEERVQRTIKSDDVLAGAFNYIRIYPVDVADGSCLCHAYAMLFVEILGHIYTQELLPEEIDLVLAAFFLPKALGGGLYNHEDTREQYWCPPRMMGGEDYAEYLRQNLALKYLSNTAAKVWMKKARIIARQLLNSAYLFCSGEHPENEFCELTERCTKLLRNMTVRPHIEIKLCRGLDGFDARTGKHRVYMVNPVSLWAHYTNESMQSLVVGYGSQQEPEADGSPKLVIYLQCDDPGEVLGKNLFEMVAKESVLHAISPQPGERRHIVHFVAEKGRGELKKAYGEEIDPHRLRPGDYFRHANENFRVIDRGFSYAWGKYRHRIIVARERKGKLQVDQIRLDKQSKNGVFDGSMGIDVRVLKFYAIPPIEGRSFQRKVRELILKKNWFPRFHLHTLLDPVGGPEQSSILSFYGDSLEECLCGVLDRMKWRMNRGSFRGNPDEFLLSLYDSFETRLLPEVVINLGESYYHTDGSRFPLPDCAYWQKSRPNWSYDNRDPLCSGSLLYDY